MICEVFDKLIRRDFAIMFFILILMHLVPPLISIFIYENSNNCVLSKQKRVVLFSIFTFFITFISYSVLWVFRVESINWSFWGLSSVSDVAFTLRYMLLSLVSALTLPYIPRYIRKISTKPMEKNNRSKDDK